ncbi:copper homeostasis protein CutC [Lacticaseibacillus parakribbianus]|uniref:copper homeostasis protein CutC n=1 Tax=Lacticaseibacillus parakribbianus TaxID=2970927 RepID=UPI0021CB315F|nr:copper homeostasis protein CutC [Lacticaseibacillus parakribbianus]
MIKEVCVENFTNVPKAIAAGALRIELNDNLPAGGTTVSRGVMAATTQYAHDHDVSVVAMIRPRGGNFVYSDTELKIMEADLFVAQELGVDAVTFGALTEDGWLDEEAMTNLIAAAGGATVVMHMAFDAIPTAQQPAAIDWLVEHGVERILTHGGPLTEPISATLLHLRELVTLAAGRIAILPGGGVTAANVAEVMAAAGVQEAHGTKVIAY